MTLSSHIRNLFTFFNQNNWHMVFSLVRHIFAGFLIDDDHFPEISEP